MRLAPLYHQHAEQATVGDRGNRRGTTVGCGGGAARADRLGDQRVIGGVHPGSAIDGDRPLSDLGDGARVAVGAQGDEGARHQVERPGKAPHQGEDHLVGPQGEAALADQAGQRPPHGPFAEGAAGALAVADSGVESGAQLGEMNRGGQGIVGAERERGGGKVGVGRGADHDDRWRVGPAQHQRPQLQLGRVGERHQNRIGLEIAVDQRRLGYHEPGTSQRPLESHRAGRRVTREQHAAAARHATERVKCIA